MSLVLIGSDLKFCGTKQKISQISIKSQLLIADDLLENLYCNILRFEYYSRFKNSCINQYYFKLMLAHKIKKYTQKIKLSMYRKIFIMDYEMYTCTSTN